VGNLRRKFGLKLRGAKMNRWPKRQKWFQGKMAKFAPPDKRRENSPGPMSPIGKDRELKLCRALFVRV
jgi:hypothetical protein